MEELFIFTVPFFWEKITDHCVIAAVPAAGRLASLQLKRMSTLRHRAGNIASTATTATSGWLDEEAVELLPVINCAMTRLDLPLHQMMVNSQVIKAGEPTVASADQTAVAGP
jgi:hypothetical protein